MAVGVSVGGWVGYVAADRGYKNDGAADTSCVIAAARRSVSLGKDASRTPQYAVEGPPSAASAARSGVAGGRDARRHGA